MRLKDIDPILADIRARKEVLIKRMAEAKWTKTESSNKYLLWNAEYYWLRVLCDSLDDAPTITPKRGKWEEREEYDGDVCYSCSACGAEYILADGYDKIDGTPAENGYNFCPRCGADNREEKTDAES